MPDYCHSCHYNRYCKDQYVRIPTCPMGYSPVGRGVSDTKAGKVKSEDTDEHVFKPEILLKIAKTAINKNDYGTAINCYEKILSIKPDHREANFLLRRAKYMAEEESGKSQPKSVKKETAKKTEEKRSGMLPQQEFRTISIKPKQKFEINPNIISRSDDKVYGVEEDQDEVELEKLSRDVAVKSRGSILKKRRTMVALGLAISIIIMIVVGLWAFGFL